MCRVVLSARRRSATSTPPDCLVFPACVSFDFGTTAGATRCCPGSGVPPQDGLLRPAADYFYYQQVAPVGDSASCGCGCVQDCLDVDADNYDASSTVS